MDYLRNENSSTDGVQVALNSMIIPNSTFSTLHRNIFIVFLSFAFYLCFLFFFPPPFLIFILSVTLFFSSFNKLALTPTHIIYIYYWVHYISIIIIYHLCRYSCMYLYHQKERDLQDPKFLNNQLTTDCYTGFQRRKCKRVF